MSFSNYKYEDDIDLNEIQIMNKYNTFYIKRAIKELQNQGSFISFNDNNELDEEQPVLVEDFIKSMQILTNNIKGANALIVRRRQQKNPVNITSVLVNNIQTAFVSLQQVQTSFELVNENLVELNKFIKNYSSEDLKEILKTRKPFNKEVEKFIEKIENVNFPFTIPTKPLDGKTVAEFEENFFQRFQIIGEEANKLNSSFEQIVERQSQIGV